VERDLDDLTPPELEDVMAVGPLEEDVELPMGKLRVGDESTELLEWDPVPNAEDEEFEPV
jgi:hypothetical protein